MTAEQAEALENPRTARPEGLPSAQAAMESGSMLCGALNQVTESTMEIQEKYPGMERLYVSCTLFGCSLELTLEQLQSFAEEVMPRLQATFIHISPPALTYNEPLRRAAQVRPKFGPTMALI